MDVLVVKGTGTVGGAGCGLLVGVAVGERTVELLFEDGLGFNGLELGFEVFEADVGGAVAAAAGVGEVVREVIDFIAFAAPIALSSTVLLDFGRVCVGVTGFGEVAGKMLLFVSGTVGQTGVVTVVELVRASHGVIGLVSVLSVLIEVEEVGVRDRRWTRADGG